MSVFHKRVLIVSDSHGQNHNLWRILEREKPYDLLIHCGDYEYELSEMEIRAGCEVRLVAGNNDYPGRYPERQEFKIGSHKVLLVHGHRNRLYAGLQALYYQACEIEADYVIFGHLHRPVMETYNGVTFLNPGSVTYPRQADHICTYMTLTFENSEVKAELHTI